MNIELFDENEKSLGFLKDDFEIISNIGVHDGVHLHVSDPTITDGAFDKDESTEAYQMTEDDYAKREDSVLAWKRRNKLGQFREVDPEELKKAEEERLKMEREERDKAGLLTVGSRCEVHIPTQATKRGVIRFIGLTKFKPGHWVGVQYDEPMGRNDGSVNGVRYFDCSDKYGAFVKPQYVEAGDFPEFGLDELDEI